MKIFGEKLAFVAISGAIIALEIVGAVLLYNYICMLIYGYWNETEIPRTTVK